MDRRRDQRGAGGRPDDGGAVRKLSVTAGLEALHRKAPDPGVSAEAGWRAGGALVAVACSEPPSGRKQWTLRLLANKLVALEVVDTVSYETVRQPLAASPAQTVADRALVHPARGESRVRLPDGGRARRLRPYDPKRPQVGLDETSRQLLADVTPPQPMARRHRQGRLRVRERRGVVNLFLVCEPLRGWREVMVSAAPRIDWAQCSKALIDVHYPDADTDRAGPGQPQHPHPSLLVRGLPARRKPGASPTSSSSTTPPSMAVG